MITTTKRKLYNMLWRMFIAGKNNLQEYKAKEWIKETIKKVEKNDILPNKSH
jgi:hypothetical protein